MERRAQCDVLAAADRVMPVPAYCRRCHTSASGLVHRCRAAHRCRAWRVRRCGGLYCVGRQRSIGRHRARVVRWKVRCKVRFGRCRARADGIGRAHAIVALAQHTGQGLRQGRMDRNLVVGRWKVRWKVRWQVRWKVRWKFRRKVRRKVRWKFRWKARWEVRWKVRWAAYRANRT